MRRHTLFVRAVVAIFPNQRIPKMHVTDIHVPPVRIFPTAHQDKSAQTGDKTNAAQFLECYIKIKRSFYIIRIHWQLSIAEREAVKGAPA
jgi:hypothetical protein